MTTNFNYFQEVILIRRGAAGPFLKWRRASADPLRQSLFTATAAAGIEYKQLGSSTARCRSNCDRVLRRLFSYYWLRAAPALALRNSTIDFGQTSKQA